MSKHLDNASLPAPITSKIAPASSFRQLRYKYRDVFGEFIGTVVLLFLGLGVCAQINFHHATAGTPAFLLGWLAWGLAVMCGIFVSGHISGAHLNPAVTIALATHGRFSWKKVPAYIAAQLMAGFTAAALVYVF
jgi:glycerol uptake facilitator-like aquaporin